MVAMLPGTHLTKVRPAVVVSSELYHRERPDAIVGILTTQVPTPLSSTDYVLSDWREAGLRAASCFRVFLVTVQKADVAVVGRLTDRDWSQIQIRLRRGLAFDEERQAV